MASHPNWVSDLIVKRDHIGWWLRTLRLERGLSLRALELASGVSHSEIFKVEAARQECRLETFIVLCSALGVPPGRVLDDIIFANLSIYHREILRDPEFDGLLYHLNIPTSRRESVAQKLSSACTFAAILLRCASASRRARAQAYPYPDDTDDPVKTSFLDFAARLDGADDDLERSATVLNLAAHPVTTLREQRLLCERWLADKGGAWAPWAYAKPVRPKKSR